VPVLATLIADERIEVGEDHAFRGARRSAAVRTSALSVGGIAFPSIMGQKISKYSLMSRCQSGERANSISIVGLLLRDISLSCPDARISAVRSLPQITFICYAFIKKSRCSDDADTSSSLSYWREPVRIRVGIQYQTFLGAMRGDACTAGRAARQRKEDGH
jgi:hypothetical protein